MLSYRRETALRGAL